MGLHVAIWLSCDSFVSNKIKQMMIRSRNSLKRRDATKAKAELKRQHSSRRVDRKNDE